MVHLPTSLRRYRYVIAALSCLVLSLAFLTARAPAAHANAAGTAMYTPSSSNESMAYSRVIRLAHSGSENGTLLGTFEHSGLNGAPSSYVIRQSSDDGKTWSTLSTVSDGQTGSGHPWNTLYQPFLFEFPRTLGAYPAGTLLLAANLLPADGSSTDFEEWRSTDHGATWTYVETFQTGGTSGDGIWEPYLALNSSGQLVCYFSDERQNATYSQFLGHIVSNDGGVTWSANPDGSTNFAPGEVKDVASTIQADRPGMATIADLPNGNEVMSYEICGTGRNCEAHIKTSTDGGNTWGSGPSDLGTEVESTDGRYLGSSPFITWSPAGGAHGELLMTGMRTRLVSDNSFTSEDHQAVFVNYDYGSGPWYWMPAPVNVGGAGQTTNCFQNYSPDLLVSGSGESLRYTAASAVGPYGCEEVTGSASAGALPYNSTFDGTDAGWLDVGGCWSVSGGVYSETCGGTTGNKAIAGSTGWGDYTLQGDVEITSGSQAGFLVRASNPSVGSDALNGYFVGVSSTQLFLGKESGQWQSLAATDIPGGLADNTWYHITVQAIGCTFTISGNPVGSTATPISYSHTDSACFTNGAIGLRDYASTGAWRNITVTASGTTSTATATYLAPFASGSAPDWTTYGGSWTDTASGGTYADTAGGAGDKAVAGQSGWGNYSLTGDVQMNASTGPGSNAGLLVRVSSPGTGVDTLNGYFAGVSSDTLFLGKEANSWTSLATVPIPGGLADGTWYHLTVEAVGCQITVTGQPSAGGDQVSLTYNDTGCFTTGMIGARTYNSTATWRDIAVTPR
ncbi:exo-alpha-sialidase [Actinospica sp. MGRD01-02]|uniref:Exo-alpha-sialidase n=1 Tax=Actinospica acidithermotolerans TaxID=2828514 RepID=A0A941E724_9ACTN|nr:family 16 glycoside hydrolase [Actinospica acidithermotolerans]MBR7825128.1 exo-alpha-sialidase [Actinospica acidithermotolerans]